MHTVLYVPSHLQHGMRSRQKRVENESVEYQRAIPPAELTMVLALLDADDAQKVDTTFQFAAAAHAGQVRDEGTPFIDHPVAVVSILFSELGRRDVDVLMAALAHDVLEDCCIDPSALRTLIGERAFDMVEHVTKRKVPDAEKAARDSAYLSALHDAPHDVRMLKLADRIHNLRSIPLASDRDKARWYLEVSRTAFMALAARTDPTAARLIEQACDDIAAYLGDTSASGQTVG